jgi:predicted aspartyl protease
MRLLLALFAAVALAAPLDALADDSRVPVAIDANDPTALEALLKTPGLSEADAALLTGALAAMRFDDEAAIEALTKAAAGETSPRTQRQTLAMLGGVHLRASNYAAALRALDAAAAAGDTSQTDDERLGAKQTRDVAYALRAQLPQIHEPPRHGAVEISRDSADLARATGSVNGREQEFVLDTGAGYSTVTRSTAVKLGLRLLPDNISVGATAVKAVPAQLAMADEVTIAGNRFRNVVFLVLADEALSFGAGLYKIDAILGFPVLARLGRIEFARKGGEEELRIAPSGEPPRMRDLYLDMLRPMVVVEVAGAGRVRMLLDSGARRSALSALFGSTYPTLLADAESRTKTIGGAGGSKKIEVRTLEDVTVVVDERPRKLESVDVEVTDEKATEHGVVGQDLLRADGGFALDFNTMDFIFLPAQ